MSDFQIQPIAAGSAAVVLVRLLRADSPTDAPVLDETQAENPVAYDGLTFEDGWATLPWVRGPYWYWIESEDAEGRTSRGLPIWGGDQGDVEVSVGGKLAAKWATREVKAETQQLVTEGAQQYLTRSYAGTVAPDGSWLITGLPIGQVATFAFPDASRPVVTLPAVAGAYDFGALE